MAFRRKRIKDQNREFITEPRTCSFCKEKKAFTTVHGTYTVNGGRTCCDGCFPELKKQEDLAHYRESHYEMSEADYQTWGRL